MKLLVINPNSTAAMTKAIAESAAAAARFGTEIEAVSPSWGPASIESHTEEVLAAAAVAQLVAERASECDGVAIAGLAVLDGVATAVKALEGLSDLAAGTSRHAAFRAPAPKALAGEEPLLEAFRAHLGAEPVPASR